MENKVQKKQGEEFFTIGREVLRNWLIILCVSLSASLWAYIAASVMYQPSYTSSTTFVVSAKGSSMGAYANESKTQELTEIFQTVMDSHLLKKKVAQSLEMDSFPGTVSVKVLPETNLLTVSAQSNSPDMAFRLLRAMLENYQEISINVLGEVVLEVFEAPNYPSVENNPFNGKKVMKQAFVMAMAAMIGLLAVISYMKDSVKSEDDVTEKLDTKVFGVLEHERPYRNAKAFFKHKKKKLLLNEPAVSFGFVETVKKMRTKLLYKCAKNDSKIIFVTSTLKQEGKTTVAANLAFSMAMRGKRVLLIEGDLRKSNLADVLGVEIPAEYGLGDNLSEIKDIRKKIYNVKGMKLHLLVNTAKHGRSTEFLLSDNFSKFLARMRQQMDFIIIDGPSSKGRADAEVWARLSDVSLLVVKANYAKVPYINDTIDMLEAYGKGLIGCVLNDVYSNINILSSGYGYGYGYGRYRMGKYGGYGYYDKYGKYGKYGKIAEKPQSEIIQPVEMLQPVEDIKQDEGLQGNDMMMQERENEGVKDE